MTLSYYNISSIYKKTSYIFSKNCTINVQFQHNSILGAFQCDAFATFESLSILASNYFPPRKYKSTLSYRDAERNVSNTRVRGIVLSNCSKVLARLYTLLSRKRKKEKERNNSFHFLNYKCILISPIANCKYILQITLLITNRRRDRQFLSSRVDSQVP